MEATIALLIHNGGSHSVLIMSPRCMSMNQCWRYETRMNCTSSSVWVNLQNRNVCLYLSEVFIKIHCSFSSMFHDDLDNKWMTPL